MTGAEFTCLQRAADEHHANQVMKEFEGNQRNLEEMEAQMSPYSMGSRKALRTHMINIHGAEPSDFDEHDAPTRWHVGWHKDMQSWDGEDHTHG